MRVILPDDIWGRVKFARPAFVEYVRHAYQVGGFEIVPTRGAIDLDPLGLEWVRTINLREVRTGMEYRIIEPADLCGVITRYEEKVAARYIEVFGWACPRETVPDWMVWRRR